MKQLNLDEYKAVEKQPLNLSDYSTDSGVLGATKDAALKALSGAKKTIGKVASIISKPLTDRVAEGMAMQTGFQEKAKDKSLGGHFASLLFDQSKSFFDGITNKLSETKLFKEARAGMEAISRGEAKGTAIDFLAEELTKNLTETSKAFSGRGTANVIDTIIASPLNFASRSIYGKSNSVGDFMADFADEMRNNFATETSKAVSEQQFGWEKIKNPDFWMTTVAENIPVTLAFMKMSLPIAKGATGITSKLLGTSKFAKLAAPIIGAVVGSAPMTAFEAASEAEDAYKQAKQKGMGEKEAVSAGSQVFKNNIKLLSFTNSVELATALMPGGLLGKSIIGKIIAEAGGFGLQALSEGGEEVAQYHFQESATGNKMSFLDRLNDPMAQESGFIGAIMGILFQAGGRVVEHQAEKIQNSYFQSIEDRLPPEDKDKLKKAQGVKAKQKVLNEISTTNPQAVEQAVREIEKENQQSIKATKEVLDTVRSVPTAEQIAAELQNGRSPTEVALAFADKIGTEEAITLVNKVVETMPVEQEAPAIPVKEISPTGKGVKKASEELAALSDKIDERILEKTPSDLRDEFIMAQESLEKQTQEIKEAIKLLEQKVSQALPRSQEKKDLKLQLERERERIRRTEAEFQEKIYGNASAFRDFFAGLLKDKYKLDISEEEMSNLLDEIVIRTTDAGYIEGTFNVPIKDRAEQVVAEYKESKGIKPKTKKAIKTAKGAAIDMIRVSVERGDSLKSLKDGLLGVSGDEYKASIGGYVNGKNIGNNKIQVSYLNGEELAKPEIFSLEELYKEIKSQKKEKPKKEEKTEMPDIDIPEEVEEEAQEDWEENFAEEYGNLADQVFDIQKATKEAPKKEHSGLQKKMDAVIAKQAEMEEKFLEKWEKTAEKEEIGITKEAVDERANALFIKRHGQEAYDEGVRQGAFGLEKIEQFGREYDEVFLEEHPELEDVSIVVYHDAEAGDDWAVLNTETGKFVEIFEKGLLQPIDKEEKREEDKANGKDTKNRRIGIRGKEVSEPIQMGGEKPADIGGTAPFVSEGDKNRLAKRGDKFGERLGARLTNEEIDKIVSSVAEISDNKVIKLTGEITEDILNAANQYTPGGTSKEGRGILDEYYTESQVVDMVKSLIDFPVKDLRVIEPSVGTGNFLYAIPEIGNHQVAALEINPITAKIAKIFHPSVKVLNKAFEEMFITERGAKIKIEETNLADLIIGNPPYGEHRGKYLGLGEEKGITKYEDYFIKRGLDMLKEGGTLAMVVPSGFLDSGTDEVKQIITKNAELTKAYRLPVGIFKGTGIGTDIVIFKKKASASSAEQNNRLMQISRGRYFETNTNNVLGEIKERKNRFGKMEKYVDGDLSIAQSLFDQHRNDSKAKKILKNLKIEPTAENVEEAGEAIEESGDGAKEIIKEGEKAEKRLGKKIIKRVVKETVKKDDIVVPLTAQFAEISETESDLWKKTTSAGYVENPTAEEKKSLNYFLGNWYLDFNYLQGDIYEKLDTLEKQQGQISKEQYKAQKEKLEAVLPSRETLDDIKLSPNHTFVKDIVLGKDADDNDMTLRSNFLDWLGNLPRQAFGDSSNWEVRGYVNNEIVSGGDKDRNELTRVRRKIMAESLFAKYLKEDLDVDDRRLVEETYNKTYNFYHTPDYSKVPMFSEIYSSFHGGRLKLTEAQKEVIGRLVNRGVGILAHEVGGTIYFRKHRHFGVIRR